MFGNRAISSTVGHGGPPQELAMGIYSSFYAFAGMASSTRNVHLSPVEINDDLNYMNFMETVVGLQNLTMNMISET
ncbi:MAG: hypothetical protein DRP42_03445 [Tenericutes bacterium]|nr:MAG: hypothetical protein DRP42_03445 [Mycoplasmatota bacterium]